jgi:hypothetical protein
MTIDDDGGWDANDAEALRALAREVPPPAGSADRAVAALRRSGLIRGARPWRWLGVAAAVAVAFAGGVALGRNPSHPAAEDPRPQFVILLYGGDTPDAAEDARHTGEIAAWARGLAERGNALSGAKLNAHEYPLGTGGASTGDLGGYIVLAASGVEEAMAMARTCPHLRHGGRIVVRPVDPT